jgi:hypothetical protein
MTYPPEWKALGLKIDHNGYIRIKGVKGPIGHITARNTFNYGVTTTDYLACRYDSGFWLAHKRFTDAVNHILAGVFNLKELQTREKNQPSPVPKPPRSGLDHLPVAPSGPVAPGQ